HARGPAADGHQAVQGGVDADQGDGADDAPGEAVVAADDGVLHDVGQQEDDDEVEGVEGREIALSDEPEQDQDGGVNEDRPQDLLQDGYLGDEQGVPHDASPGAAGKSPSLSVSR